MDTVLPLSVDSVNLFLLVYTMFSHEPGSNLFDHNYKEEEKPSEVMLKMCENNFLLFVLNCVHSALHMPIDLKKWKKKSLELYILSRLNRS